MGAGHDAMMLPLLSRILNRTTCPQGKGGILSIIMAVTPTRGHLTQGPAIRSNATICNVKTSLGHNSPGKGSHDTEKG